MYMNSYQNEQTVEQVPAQVVQTQSEHVVIECSETISSEEFQNIERNQNGSMSRYRRERKFREWSPSDLKAAVNHVLNKGWTVFRASRAFGIPYNTLKRRCKKGKTMDHHESRERQIIDPLSAAVYTAVRRTGGGSASGGSSSNWGSHQEKAREQCNYQFVPVEHVTYATLLPTTQTLDTTSQSNYYTLVASHGNSSSTPTDSSHPIVVAVASSDPPFGVNPSTSNQRGNQSASQGTNEPQQASVIASRENNPEGVIVGQDVSQSGNSVNIPVGSVLVHDKSMANKNTHQGDGSMQPPHTIAGTTTSEAGSEPTGPVAAPSNMPSQDAVAGTSDKTAEEAQDAQGTTGASTATATTNAGQSKDANSETASKSLRGRLRQVRLKARPYEHVVLLPQKRTRTQKTQKASDSTLALISVERARLAVEKERLAVEKERLKVECDRLSVERERLGLEKACCQTCQPYPNMGYQPHHPLPHHVPGVPHP